MLCCLPLAIRGRHQIVHALIAILFCGCSTYLAQQNGPLAELLENPTSSPVFFDLEQDLVPVDAQGFIAVHGNLQTNFILDEYQVQAGQRPDQNRPADIVLLAMLSEEPKALDPQHIQIIARITKDHPLEPKRQRLIGYLRPAPTEVLAALIDIQGPQHQIEANHPDGQDAKHMAQPILPKGAILDTLQLPSPQILQFRSILAMALGMLSLSLLVVAARRKNSLEKTTIVPES